jgi:hypothetical protein
MPDDDPHWSENFACLMMKISQLDGTMDGGFSYE